jgi:hypothetical protein
LEISTGTPWPSLLHDRRRVPSTDVTDRYPNACPACWCLNYLVDGIGWDTGRPRRTVARDGSVAALITKATGRRSACRTPRVGELRPLRPVSLTCCVNKTKGVSAHKNLNWLDSSQKARYRRTDGPSRERADAPVSPPAELPRLGADVPPKDCHCPVIGPPRDHSRLHISVTATVCPSGVPLRVAVTGPHAIPARASSNQLATWTQPAA